MQAEVDDTFLLQASRTGEGKERVVFCVSATGEVGKNKVEESCECVGGYRLWMVHTWCIKN